MKVVLFCGGMGLRLREHSETIPKPMAAVGHRPILWHIMMYYAHYGHKEFILCLGWQGNVIKEYFLNYDECVSNDFTLSNGGASIELINSDIDDWSITFVDTGIAASIGERLRAVEPYLAGDDVFLANYADDLTDFPLPRLVRFFHDRRPVAAFLCVRPSQSFHTVSVGGDGTVRCVRPVAESDVWINGGYFVLHRDVFRYLRDGEDLLAEPFDRLIAEGRLAALQYDGFWGCMDTYKEKQRLDDMVARGLAPWEVWKHAPSNGQRLTIDRNHPRRWVPGKQ